MKTTVGDLIAALSKYPVGTPVAGITPDAQLGVGFSIQEAHDLSGKDGVLVSVSLHVWSDKEVQERTDPGIDILGFVEPAGEPLPRIVPMDSFPANSNPFHHDLYHMGCAVSGPWMAMYAEHAGHKQDHNKTAEEKATMKPVWHDDPSYIIMVNQRTGQRFKMVWDNVDRADHSEVMQAILLKREIDLAAGVKHG